ncbi:hypothetical protein FFK22_024655 [Mycobacterium sp. KBS0706]|uniref:PBECR2 nuclease fold domain-containing protein n=1 Tax=Mycobacterium sp. KBS0706 TaxID=2578109 RepID=UPI00110FB9A7|nr:PBECR2 nuclease fold domain-containing protein [Mycobacterium sp. KBS0706]TSD86013.1 hypothetical protein FFK22_024655 [Mycobacterium sp. KBS0706]
MVGEAVPVSLTPVHFIEAIDHFRSKTNLPTNSWSDLMHQAHARAFSVAGATSASLLADFRQALDQAIASGGTLETFRADFDRIVAQHGWSYHGSRNWRSRVIFETNTRMAYSSGRWQQAQRLKATRPYARYVDVHDARTRPEHYAWHDIVLPIDHPWWKTHWPPNGWNCRCHAQSLSERDLKRFGLKVTVDPPEIEMEPREVRAPDGSTEIIWTPKGIDTGFGYNPGDSWMRGVTPPELRQPLPRPKPSSPPLPGQAPSRLDALPRSTSIPHLPPLPSMPLSPVPELPIGLTEENFVRAFLQEFGGQIGQPLVWRDPSGTRTVITDELFRTYDGTFKVTRQGRDEYLLALAAALKDPDEIWLDWFDVAQPGQPTNYILRRRYLRRFDDDKRRGGLVAFEWTPKGWSSVTLASPTSTEQLSRARYGILLYQR